MITLKIDRRLLLVVPALVVLLAYLPALQNGFVWDDNTFLHDSPLYRDPNLFFDALRLPFVISANYFRPLAILTFIAELRLVGLNPFLFHLDNLILHTLNTLLVTIVAGYVVKREGEEAGNRQGLFIQIGAGLLYGLHPALIEGVAFVSSRFDLLCTLLLLVALWADARLAQRPARPLVVGGLFLLAALTKEMAIAFVIVLPLWHLVRAWQPEQKFSFATLRAGFEQRGDFRTYVALVLAGVLYLVIRFVALGYVLQTNLSHIPTGDLAQHALLVARSFVEYLLLVVLPFITLTPIHFAVLPLSLSDPLAWTAVVALLALAFGFYQWLKREPRSGLLALAGILALLPVVNILPLDLTGGAFIAERFLLFPLTLFAFAFAALLSNLPLPASLTQRRASTLYLPLATLWLLASVFTIELVLPHWQNNFTFWSWASERAPNSATVFVNLSLEYSNRGDYNSALAAAQRAVQLDPQEALGWNNAGLALYNLKQLDNARAAFDQATKLEPQNALYWNNLAGVLMDQGNLADAEKILLDEALKRDPNQPLALMNLGSLYLQADRPDLAVPYLQQALRLLPSDQNAKAKDFMTQASDPVRWLKLADDFNSKGDGKSALAALDQAQALGANQVEVAVERCAAYLALDDPQTANTVCQATLTMAPNDARLFYLLGVSAQKRGDLIAARDYYTHALQLAPNWNLPQQSLDALPK